MDCWNECLAQQVTIPHRVLKIYDEDGNLQSVQLTGFLEDDNDSNSIDGAECDPQEDEEEERLVDVQQVGQNDKMCMAIKNNLKSKEGQENYETALTVVQSKSWQSTLPLNGSSRSGRRVSLQSATAMSQQQMTFELILEHMNYIRP